MSGNTDSGVRSPLTRSFFRSATLMICLSFLPIESISMVLCTRKFSDEDKSQALKIILKRMEGYTNIKDPSAWEYALSCVPRSDVIHTINRVYRSYVHGEGISRNLLHPYSSIYFAYWINFISNNHETRRPLADLRYSGFFSSVVYRNALCNQLKTMMETETRVYNESHRPHHSPETTRYMLDSYQKFNNVCNFLVELLETSFSLGRINVEGRRWGFSFMHKVDQTNPRLFIDVSEDDVCRLNERYMADDTQISRFTPFDYNLTSKIGYWTDYHFPEPFPDPPLE